MGSIVDCFDNSVAESFFGTLQLELPDEHRWSSRRQLATAIFDWIETWYDPHRRHSHCGMLSPLDYEIGPGATINTTPPSAGPGDAQTDSRVRGIIASPVRPRVTTRREMAQQNIGARTLHDVGLAAWFGGSLMGAVGLNGAAASVEQPGDRAKVANAGWARWTPVNAAAIGAHLLGGLMLIGANKGRLQGQQGVGSATGLKTVLTLAALGATAYSRIQGQKVMDAGTPPVTGATEPSSATPPEVAGAQKQLRALQWAIPALTGAVLVLNARMGEQQRPLEMTKGVLSRLNPLT